MSGNSIRERKEAIINQLTFGHARATHIYHFDNEANGCRSVGAERVAGVCRVDTGKENSFTTRMKGNFAITKSMCECVSCDFVFNFLIDIGP